MKKNSSSNEQVPWVYRGKVVTEVAEGAVGFVYLITVIWDCPIEGARMKDYVGRKQVMSNNRKKIGVREKAATGTRKKYKIVSKDSGWQTYMGSCKELLEFIETVPKAVVTKEITYWCYNKKQLSYYEHKEQFMREMLERDTWNFNIGSHWYRRDLIRPIKTEV